MSKANIIMDNPVYRPELDQICVQEHIDDKYWERRCHQAEEHLQEIARELEKTRGEAEYLRKQLVCLEQDRRILGAQLDVVHLIFG